MTNMTNSWEEKARNEVFNKFAFVGDRGQLCLDDTVFPFIRALLRETEQRVREEKIDAFKTTAEFAKVAAEIRKDATEKARAEIKQIIKKLKIERAHTYASENAEIYHSFDAGQERFRELILAALSKE